MAPPPPPAASAGSTKTAISPRRRSSRWPTGWAGMTPATWRAGRDRRAGAVRARRPAVVDAVLAALDEANRTVIGRDEAHRMGTTVTGLASLVTPAGDQVMVFNVGDSRVYRLAGDQFGQLTVDHSEVQELVLSGAITPEQARIHPRRNIVTRALGSDFVVRPDHWLLPAPRRRSLPGVLRRPDRRADGRGDPAAAARRRPAAGGRGAGGRGRRSGRARQHHRRSSSTSPADAGDAGAPAAPASQRPAATGRRPALRSGFPPPAPAGGPGGSATRPSGPGPGSAP